MKRYRAIFLDRDGTLSRHSARKIDERNKAIGAIIGKDDFQLTDEMNMNVFWRISRHPSSQPVKCLASEDKFWLKWYQTILEDHGIRKDSRALAADLYGRFCFYRDMMEPYPETVGVLKALKDQGYPMGVISDTFPSLEESLKSMDIAKYFDSYVCSALVGVGKPDPRIFNAALESLGVRAEDSIFVDDTKREADGAREQGFTSFHLVRQLPEPDFANWTIGNLEHLLWYIGF